MLGHVMKRILGYMLKNYKFFVFYGGGLYSGGGPGHASRNTVYAEPDRRLHCAPYECPDTGFFISGSRLGSLAVTYGLGVVCAYAYNRIMVNVSQGTMKKLRVELFTHMESLPVKYFDTHAHGDIMSVYTNDVDTLRQLISQSIPQVVSSAVTIVTTLVSMIVLDIPLTAVTLIMTGLMLFATSKLGGKSAAYFIRQQKDLGTVNGYIEEMMDGQKVVKVFCHEEKSLEQFRRINEELRESANLANKFSNIMMPVNGNLGNISYVLCAVVGAVMALGGNWGLTLGTLVSFLTLNKNFTQPVTQISQQMNSIVMAMAGAERISECWTKSRRKITAMWNWSTRI